MKKKIITITGFPGSGKSSTAKAVSAVLGYEHFSSGDLFRQMARERGLSVEQINFAAEKQTAIDQEVDELLVRIGNERNNLVIDSRTAFHWIPDSFKVLLDLDPSVAARRVFAVISQSGRESQSGTSVEEVFDNSLKRRQSEKMRYRNLYKIDIEDKTQFDLVVDTALYDLQAVVGRVVASYKDWLGNLDKKSI